MTLLGNFIHCIIKSQGLDRVVGAGIGGGGGGRGQGRTGEERRIQMKFILL